MVWTIFPNLEEGTSTAGDATEGGGAVEEVGGTCRTGAPGAELPDETGALEGVEKDLADPPNSCESRPRPGGRQDTRDKKFA